nr:NAD(P)H-hydrate epimerase [Celeribacter litoreus]
MAELLTSAQMRAIEKAAIDSGEVTGLDLMERAGAGVVNAVFEEWPDLAQSSYKAVVLCGPGNNGGDGFVITRLLKQRGWEVEVFLYGDPEKLPPDAKVNYERWAEMGEVAPYVDEEFQLDPAEYRETSVMFDALFGTGLTRAVEGFNEFAWHTQISEFRMAPKFRKGAFVGSRVVAVDAPSGLCADSGRYLATNDPYHESIRADLTVSFHRMKLGHVLADGPHACGKTVVVDIGLTERHKEAVQLTDPTIWELKKT